MTPTIQDNDKNVLFQHRTYLYYLPPSLTTTWSKVSLFPHLFPENPRNCGLFLMNGVRPLALCLVFLFVCFRMEYGR